MDLHQPMGESIINGLNAQSGKYLDLVRTGHQGEPTIRDNGKMDFQLQQVMATPDGSAEAQYLTKIDVNTGFFHKCSPSLRRNILDEFHQRDKSYMFRCVRHSTQQVNQDDFYTCRAVLGPNFPTDCDDHRLYPIVLEALSGENVTLRRFFKNDHLTELKVLYNDVNVGMDENTVYGTLSISNSETGHSAIWIEPNIEIFNNIYLGNNRGDGTTRVVHRGALPTVDEIREAVIQAKRVAQVGVIQYLEQAKMGISRKQASDYMENLLVLPRRMVKIIEEDLKDAELIAKSELLRRILIAAAGLPLIQELQVRREVGKFVGVFEGTASRMAALANQLNQE